MGRKRAAIGLALLLCMMLSALVLSGCGSGRTEAEQALSTYLTAVMNKQPAEAFQLVSDFDKQTMTEEAFAAWRTSVEGVVDKKSFNIIRMADRFMNYEYMGTRFGDAYGFEVGWEQESLVPDAQKTDYDEDSFLIMMVEENGRWKVFLMLPDLPDRTAQYQKQLQP